LLAWDLRGRLERVTLSTTFASEWPEIVTTLKRYGAAIEDWTPNDTDSPITNALRKGVLLFNHHLFFAVHEVLEAQWMRETGAEKRFLQGLVQIAVAFYHLGNRNLRGALSLLQDGIEKIAPHQPVYLGIELRDFIAALEICDAELRHLNPDSLAQFPVTLIPPIRFTLTTDSETKHGLSSDKKVSD
jgi:hypothetical protein